MHNKNKTGLWNVVPLFIGLVLSTVFADHMNIDEGLPVRLEDAYPLAYRDREIQISFEYVEQQEQQYRMNLTPIFEVGFPLNTQLEIDVPLIFGQTDKTGSADIRTSLLYNFNMEGVYFPAIALEAAVDIPTGNGSKGVDPLFKLLVTKTVGSGRLNRIHLNGEYKFNTDPQSNERRHLHTVIAGYSQRITPNSIVIFDFYRERERQENSVVNVIEAGTRTQLDPLTVLSIGGGVGIGLQSQRFQVTIGLQRSLSGQFFLF